MKANVRSMKEFIGDVEPGCYAVIFSNRQSTEIDGYDATAARMVELAREQTGFLGIESVRREDGFGITVSYWEGEESIREGKKQSDHAEAQRRGRGEWYESFDLRVCRVERAYGFAL